MTVQNHRIIGIGQDLGPYRIEALLGTGGMGIVYRARHLQLKRTVAIKMVDRRRSKADAERWQLQEARLAAALNHPCICNVHDIGYVGRPAVHRDGARRREVAQRADSGRAGLSRGDGAALRPADRRRGCPRARPRHRAPRSEKLEHHRRARRPREAARLRARRAPPTRTRASWTRPARRRCCRRRARCRIWRRSCCADDRPIGAPTSGRSACWCTRCSPGVGRSSGATRYELAAAILGDPVVPLAREVPAGWRSVVARSLMKNPAERYQCAREVSAALDDLVVRVSGGGRANPTMRVVYLVKWPAIMNNPRTEPQAARRATAFPGPLLKDEALFPRQSSGHRCGSSSRCAAGIIWPPSKRTTLPPKSGCISSSATTSRCAGSKDAAVCGLTSPWVVQRLFLDHRNRQWGKWRPSAEAKRRGPLAILLERLVVRDGWTFEQAVETLRTNHRGGGGWDAPRALREAHAAHPGAGSSSPNPRPRTWRAARRLRTRTCSVPSTTFWPSACRPRSNACARR